MLIINKGEAQSSPLAIADSLYALANYTQAINNYAKIGSPKAGLQIARSYNAIGNYAKAIAQYEHVVVQNPSWFIARYELGKLYLKTKNLNQSLHIFNFLIQEQSDNPAYHYYQGESYRKLDSIAHSIKAYKKAIQLDSTHLKSMYQLGKHFVQLRQKTEAITYLNMGLRFYPNDIALTSLKGQALYNNGEYAKALPLFKRLIELGEKKEFVYGKLAHCYFKVWDFEKAIETYRVLLALNPEKPNTYFNIAQVFFKDRQLDSAKIYVQKSIDMKAVTFEKEYANLAHIYRSESKLKKALKYYDLAYKEDPSNHLNYYQICAMIDQTSKNLGNKLKCYEGFIDKFGSRAPAIFFIAKKRISELKEEIHFNTD